MSIVEARLSELGLRLPEAPTPVGAYATWVAAGDLLFLSGTTCYLDGGLLAKGKVGTEVTLEEGYQAARQTALNLLAVLKQALGDLDRVARVLKVNGYVNSAPGFDRQPQVINGASELFLAVFGDRGVHARTSIGVSELPGQIPVEIEMVVQTRTATPSPPDGSG
ncbi:MAG: RidA family protein [Anaerolineales bacterium]|nr:RidA family protein [Anaerolineales bacterium]